MKVDIGPYVDEGERLVDIRIDNYDTWNMDHTLALIILPMLKQLKNTKQGAPHVDNEDVPEELRMPEGWYEEKYNKNGETDPNFFKRWDWVMDEMIWSFQHQVDDEWEDMFFKDEEPNYEIKELEFKGIGPAQIRLFPDDNGETEDYEMYEWVRNESAGKFDQEGYRRYSERIANGFRLFGKYYQSLWD
jgi:hypothetical protein